MGFPCKKWWKNIKFNSDKNTLPGPPTPFMTSTPHYWNTWYDKCTGGGVGTLSIDCWVNMDIAKKCEENKVDNNNVSISGIMVLSKNKPE